MVEPYDTRVSDILASKQFLERHPGSSQLGSDLFSSAVNSVSEILLRQRYVGQYVSQSNNLVFGGQSSFFLTPGSIMNGLVLTATLNSLPRYTRAPDLWLLNAIDSVELVISGSSSVQSLKVSGRSHMDYIIASLDSRKMNALIAACPYIDLSAAAGNVTASIPLNLFFSSDDISSVFPLDTSTLQSQIIINVRWKQAYNVFYSDSGQAAVTLPTAFTSLYMRVGDQVTVGNNFALSDELRRDPLMIYSLPMNYLQTYSQVVPVTIPALPAVSSEASVSLTSMPSGQLQCILVSIGAIDEEGSATSSITALVNPWTVFNSIRMLYNGIEVYRADSPSELILFNSQMADKDSMLFSWRNFNALADAGVSGYSSYPVIIMPMTNDVSEVLRGRRHEHTHDYSGSTLQFFFTLSAAGARYVTNAAPVSSQSVHTQATGNGFRLNFTFVNAGLIEVNQRTISLTM